MTNGDAGTPTEIGQAPAERDLGKELSEASEIGRIVLGVARERTVSPQYQVRKYTMPMLDHARFPNEAVGQVTQAKKEPTEEDIQAAKEASVALTVEAALQILEARPTKQIIEDANSLEQMGQMVGRGAGLIIQVEATDPEIVVRAGREAIERRKGAKGLEDSESWDDQKVLGWTKSMLNRAGGLLTQKINALRAYHGR